MKLISKLTGIAISAVFLFADPMHSEGNAKSGKKSPINAVPFKLLS